MNIENVATKENIRVGVIGTYCTNKCCVDASYCVMAHGMRMSQVKAEVIHFRPSLEPYRYLNRILQCLFTLYRYGSYRPGPLGGHYQGSRRDARHDIEPDRLQSRSSRQAVQHSSLYQ
jgi:hypothetical protein